MAREEEKSKYDIALNISQSHKNKSEAFQGKLADIPDQLKKQSCSISYIFIFETLNLDNAAQEWIKGNKKYK